MRERGQFWTSQPSPEQLQSSAPSQSTWQTPRQVTSQLLALPQSTMLSSPTLMVQLAPFRQETVESCPVVMVQSPVAWLQLMSAASPAVTSQLEELQSVLQLSPQMTSQVLRSLQETSASSSSS